MKRSAVLLYGGVCYSIFLFTFLYAIGFTGNLIVPKTVDSGAPAVGVAAVIGNIALLSVFALQHSIMARPAFKKWWLTIIPASIERSTYVLLASLALLLLFYKWQAFTGVVWRAGTPVMRYAVNGLFFLGWGSRSPSGPTGFIGSSGTPSCWDFSSHSGRRR